MLPLPQTTAIVPCGIVRCVSSKRPRPARSISSMPAIPRALIAQPVERALGGGAGQRIEPVGQRAHVAIATAEASVRVCVSETLTSVTPSAAAASAAAPWRTIEGAPSPRTTSTSVNAHASSPSAFATASFAQKRAARCCPGRARCSA